MTRKRKPMHGGAREGAGRKPRDGEAATERVSVFFTASTLERLQALAAAGERVADVVHRAVREFLKRSTK